MKNITEKSAIQNEQQTNDKNKAINEIIKVLFDNNMSIHDAREVLTIASRRLGNQKITSVSV